MDDTMNFGVHIIKPGDGKQDELVLDYDTELARKQRSSYVGLPRAI